MSLGCSNILSVTELERYRVRLERALPVKGKKEFAPSGSWVERKQLEAAQDERHALLKEERVERVGTLSVAEWDEKMNVAVVTYSVGKHWENFGHQQGQIRCLDPEEALFLLETSNLLLLHNNVGLSVQQGYNTLLGQRTGCTVDCYRVFSHLARQGFRLRRHDGPLFILTEYERRIGLQSYLYPKRRSIVSTQEQPNDHNRESENDDCHENTAEISMSSEGNDDEIATNNIKSEYEDTLPENHIKTETDIEKTSEAKLFTSLGDEIICSTVKSENSELVIADVLGLCTDNRLSDSTGISIVKSNTNFKNGEQHLSSKRSSDDISSSRRRTENSSEIEVSKTVCSSVSAEDTVHNVKHEVGTDDFSFKTENNKENSHEKKIVISDIEMKMENGVQRNSVNDGGNIVSGSASNESSLKDVIKKETIVTENSCDVSVDGTDSCNIIESVGDDQELDTHLHSKVPEVSGKALTKKENIKISHEVCLISDSSVSGFSDIIIEQEEQEQNKKRNKTNHPPVVNLVNSDENKFHNFRRKMQSPYQPVIIEEFSGTPNPKINVGQQSTRNNYRKREVDIADISSTEESMTSGKLNLKTIGGQKAFIKKSLKCEIDITDISSAEESVDVCPDVTSNKVEDDIVCVDHKRKPKRKRVFHRKTSVKSEKSYVVDLETGSVMRSHENLVPRKIAKREKPKEINEVIIVDDIDSPCGNDGTVELKDDELELELSKFYEEIMLVDLTGEDTRTKTRSEILDMFPNFAGVKIATVIVPPSDLLPANVTPSQREYRVDLQSLLSDRPNWIVRRHQYRGRDTHHRFRPRRGYFRHQQYRGSPHRRIADERNYVDPQAVSEEFSHNIRVDYDRQSGFQNYCNVFSHQTQEQLPFAVVDTSGDFSAVKRFEHQQRFIPTSANKQWYERTWITGSQSDVFMQHSNSASPQHYEQMAVDNRFAGHQHSHQRWNRRYNRNTSNRRYPSGRAKFRSSHHPAPHKQHTTRSVNSPEQTTEINWQNILNVAGNAESWLDFKKKLLSGKNSEKPSMEPDLETSMKAEEDDDEEEEDDDDDEEERQPVESVDEEAEEEEVEWKPLIQPSDCTDTGSILTKLHIFKEIPSDKVQMPHAETGLKINYDIYLPTTRFKKSSPCLPDYRLCIIGCEGDVPSAGEISFLLKDLHDDVPLLFAVVVPDSIAFYHFVNISLPVDNSCPV